MFVLESLFIVILFILIYYLYYRYGISFNFAQGRIKQIKNKNNFANFHQNLNVIVYSQNNAETITNLIESLKNQDYSKDRYVINVVLDNCTDDSAKLLEILGGVRIWRISTGDIPLGKNKSIAWLLERILSTENTNSFVFINADCYVKEDFLARVNNAVHSNPVVVGNILPLDADGNNLATNIKVHRNKMRFFNKSGRFWAKLGNFIDTDICAIRQEIFEKIPFIQEEKEIEEFSYSLKLTQNEILVTPTPFVVAYKNIKEDFNDLYRESKESARLRLTTLKEKLPTIFEKNSILYKEQLLSLVYPTGVVFISLSFVLIHFSFSPKVAKFLLAGYIFSYIFNAMSARFNYNDYKYSIISAIFSPAISLVVLANLIKDIFNIKNIKHINLSKLNILKLLSNKEVINTQITDGRREIDCELIIKKGRRFQAILNYRRKILKTGVYNNVIDAIEELSQNLREHGFILKNCINCGYYMQASEQYGLNNCCLYPKAENINYPVKDTHCWDTCDKIVSSNARVFIQTKLGYIEQKVEQK